jgi:hypothetical protein
MRILYKLYKNILKSQRKKCNFSKDSDEVYKNFIFLALNLKLWFNIVSTLLQFFV